jgi:hypothetical protein
VYLLFTLGPVAERISRNFAALAFLGRRKDDSHIAKEKLEEI